MSFAAGMRFGSFADLWDRGERRHEGAGHRASPPQKLFERVYAYGAGITIANYDVTADGQRFLMVKEEATAGRLRMILNWSPGPSH